MWNSQDVKKFRQPLSPAMKTIGIVTGIAAIVYCVICYMGCTLYGFATDCTGFLKVGATQICLPPCLIFFCIGHSQFNSLVACRSEPRLRLHANLFHAFVCSIGTAAVSVGLFSGIIIARIGLADGSEFKYIALTLLMTYMMNFSLCLITLLFACCGVPWTYITAFLIGFYIVANWVFMPLSDTVIMVLTWFWYPISSSIQTVAIYQFCPFLGFCIASWYAIRFAFEHHDHLKG